MPMDEALERLQQRSEELAEMRARKDAAYHERNRLAALLATLYRAGTRRTEIEGWDPEWHGCVYIDLPTGQISFHFHDRDAHLFAHLPPYEKEYDGHTKEQVWERVEGVKTAMHSFDGKVRQWLSTAPARKVAGRTLEEWRAFARRDDCLDQMVPSDLRELLRALAG